MGKVDSQDQESDDISHILSRSRAVIFSYS